MSAVRVVALLLVFTWLLVLIVGPFVLEVEERAAERRYRAQRQALRRVHERIVADPGMAPEARRHQPH